MSRSSERSNVDDENDLVGILVPIDQPLLVKILDLVVVDRFVTSARMIAEYLAAGFVIRFCSHHEEGAQQGGDQASNS